MLLKAVVFLKLNKKVPMSDSSTITNAKINLHALESRAKEITKATQAIRVITELLEDLRAHHSGDCPLGPDYIDKLSQNGYILSCFSDVIELVSGTIDAHMYELLECDNKQE